MKEEFTTISKNADGSTTECTATFENGGVSFEQSSTPAPGALPVPTQEDAGKAVIVDENGQYGLGTISGGTKLYKHRIVFGTFINLEIISTSSEAISSLGALNAEIDSSIKNNVSGFGPATNIDNQIYKKVLEYNNLGSIVSITLILGTSTWTSESSTLSYSYSAYSQTTSVTDEVTEL